MDYSNGLQLPSCLQQPTCWSCQNGFLLLATDVWMTGDTHMHEALAISFLDHQVACTMPQWLQSYATCAGRETPIL